MTNYDDFDLTHDVFAADARLKEAREWLRVVQLDPACTSDEVQAATDAVSYETKQLDDDEDLRMYERLMSNVRRQIRAGHLVPLGFRLPLEETLAIE